MKKNDLIIVGGIGLLLYLMTKSNTGLTSIGNGTVIASGVPDIGSINTGATGSGITSVTSGNTIVDNSSITGS